MLAKQIQEMTVSVAMMVARFLYGWFRMRAKGVLMSDVLPSLCRFSDVMRYWNAWCAVSEQKMMAMREKTVKRVIHGLLLLKSGVSMRMSMSMPTMASSFLSSSS